MTVKITPPYYPIVYVRGYAMRQSDQGETFNDTYYGFSATSVEKRDAPPPTYFEVDVFEGQLIRFMKMKNYGYADAVNRGLEDCNNSNPPNPSRSIFISRFYDKDYLTGKVRSIQMHAQDLQTLICETIPKRLKCCGVDLGANDNDYKVILIAHSMGGLVCRRLIQNLLPEAGQDPKRWIHRLVTIGTPHGGIDLGMISDVFEDFITSTLNPFDAGIFKEERMRKYLKLDAKAADDEYIYDIHSLGAQDKPLSFPVKHCLCIIGSDYKSYNIVKVDYFYDFEFLFSIKNSGAYLHRRQQDPCENAMRIARDEIAGTQKLVLHTGFMNSELKDDGNFSHFMFKLRIVEHCVKDGLLWDREYPDRPIYNETLEIRVGDSDPKKPGDEVEYRWLSDISNEGPWTALASTVVGNNWRYRLPLRRADAISGAIIIEAGRWNA